MNKNALFGFSIVIILTCSVYFICEGKSNQTSTTIHVEKSFKISLHQPENNTVQKAVTSMGTDRNSTSSENADPLIKKNDSIPLTWKTYTNVKYGFSFQYPGTWIKNVQDANAINLSGTIVATEINFIDTISHTNLSIEFHLAPKGAGFYKYKVSQYESAQGWYAKDSKETVVAGNKAIEAFTIIKIDGKGNTLNPPLRLLLVDFLDMRQTGAIELEFKTPLPNDDIEIAKFQQLLSTFKLTESKAN